MNPNRPWLRIAPLFAALALLVPMTIAQGPPRQPNQQQPTHQQPAQGVERQIQQAEAAMRNQDYATAMKTLHPIAKQGHPMAQCLVAVMHQKGYGVPRNPMEAVRWYTIASLQGSPDAMFMLGQMYYRGEGIAPDLAKAADLFLLAATRGDPDGQWAFGLCVAGGEGRPKDAIEGHAWLLLSAQQGHPEAKKEIDGAKLSADDVSIARGLAAQLKEMVDQKSFAKEKLPKVPVPDGMSTDPHGPPIPPGPNQPQSQDEDKLIEAQMDIDAELSPTGDIRGRATMLMPPEFYKELLQVVPDPKLFLRDLKSSRSNQELAPDATARYDQANSSVILDMHMLGSALNRGDGLWEWETENHKLVEIADDGQGRKVAKFDFELMMEDEGMVFRGKGVYRLPEGATDPRWDASESKLGYRLPYTGPMGKGRLKVKFDVRDRIMSCLYKVYGLETDFASQWVAKAVFTNTGDGPITDLKVRFKLGAYSELDLWQKFPEIVPGQTAVAVYHPVLKKTIAELTSTTPANIVAEWKYTDSEGVEHEDGDGGRIAILGRHEFVFSNLTEAESTGSYYDVFSNAEFVAAWVTRDDPVVKQFAAAANKAAGGHGAVYSDEAAAKVLKACYDLWQANDFTYQGPVGLEDDSMSFDNKIVQSMKFPRDVIRDRSGTCIELAALYCAMAHAVGLESYMMLVPGHAFPVIQMPGGGYLPVECTGVGGGKKFGSAPFEKVVHAASEAYKKWAEKGLVIEVDIDAAWLSGVSNPELEQLPADILQRWGLVLELDPPPPTDEITGTWVGTATQPVMGGGQVRWSMEIVFTKQGDGYRAESSGTARVPNGWGGSSNYRFDQSLQGRIQDGRLELRGTSKTLTVDGQAQRLPTDTLTLGAQDGRLVGQFRLPDGTIVKVDVQRRG